MCGIWDRGEIDLSGSWNCSLLIGEIFLPLVKHGSIPPFSGSCGVRPIVFLQASCASLRPWVWCRCCCAEVMGPFFLWRCFGWPISSRRRWEGLLVWSASKVLGICPAGWSNFCHADWTQNSEPYTGEITTVEACRSYYHHLLRPKIIVAVLCPGWLFSWRCRRRPWQALGPWGFRFLILALED